MVGLGFSEPQAVSATRRKGGKIRSLKKKKNIITASRKHYFYDISVDPILCSESWEERGRKRA